MIRELRGGISAGGSVEVADGSASSSASSAVADRGEGEGGGRDEVEARMLGGVLIGDGGGEAWRRRLVRREERKAGRLYQLQLSDW